MYSNYTSRLIAGIKKRGLDPEKDSIESFIRLLRDRATTERGLDGVFQSLIDLVEIRSCEVSHCDKHGAHFYSCCREELEPGKCPIAKKYRANLKKRCQDKYDEIMDKVLLKVKNEIGLDRAEFFKKMRLPDYFYQFKEDIITRLKLDIDIPGTLEQGIYKLLKAEWTLTQTKDNEGK